MAAPKEPKAPQPDPFEQPEEGDALPGILPPSPTPPHADPNNDGVYIEYPDDPEKGEVKRNFGSDFTRRYWLAGPNGVVPQPTIMIPGQRLTPLKFRNGFLEVNDPKHAELVEKALGVGRRVWIEDYPEDQPAPMNNVTGYAPRSFGAQAAQGNYLYVPTSAV